MFSWVNFPHRRLLISGSGRDGDERRTTRVAGTGTAVVAAAKPDVLCLQEVVPELADSLRSSHPIQVPIPTAEEVDEIFDAISYCKGGSVIRMIYATLGVEKFQ